MSVRYLIALLACFALVQAGGAMQEKKDEKKEEKVITTKSGLKYVEQKEGTGREPQNGDVVSVHYTGWLKDGTKFDSSRDRGRPLEFVLGIRKVIAGWDEGLLGMKVGGKRKLIIPSELAYGKAGRDGIPPDAELTFEVELVKVGQF